MTDGKVDHITKHFKDTLGYLPHAQRTWIIDQLRLWASPKPKLRKLSTIERIRFKWRLFVRYGPQCAYCHKESDWRHALTLDHLQPVNRGGPMRDIQNMVLACRECNRNKANTWP